MNTATLARSLLFVPGDRPERFTKAAQSGADGIILDLEDAVAPADKAQARAAIAGWCAQPPAHTSVWIRVNGADSPWLDDDLQLLASLPADVGVMCPKATTASLRQVQDQLAPPRPLLALVESVAGVLEVQALARIPGVQRLAFGNLDFSVDAGMTPDAEETELASVRTALVLASRQAGLPPPLDGVTPDLQDDAGLARAAARAQRGGFGGKLCIHPRQVALVHAAWRPSAAQLAWAQAVLAAASRSQGGVVQHQGQMIDAPVIAQAQRLLARERP